MRCKKIKKELSAYYDGELCAKKTRLIKEHLEICPKCRAFFQEMIGALKPLKEAGHEEVPERIWQNISANLQPKKENFFGEALDVLMGWVYPRRRYVILAFSIIFVFAVAIKGIGVYKDMELRDYIIETRDFVSPRGLGDYISESVLPADEIDLNSPFEEYLLS